MPEFHSDLSVQEIKVRVVANRKRGSAKWAGCKSVNYRA